MKKILSLLTMMTVFCVLGFAQSAPKTAKKAMMLGDNAQIKDLKTGQVLKTVNAKKEVPYVYGTVSGLGNGTQSINTKTVIRKTTNSTTPTAKKQAVNVVPNTTHKLMVLGEKSAIQATKKAPAKNANTNTVVGKRTKKGATLSSGKSVDKKVIKIVPTNNQIKKIEKQ